MKVLTEPIQSRPKRAPVRWLNRTVPGIGLASLFSPLSHEIATAALPAFLATMGLAAAGLGIIAIMTLPAGIWRIVLIFVLGGIQVAVEETLEDSFCAELVDEAHRGMAFGMLATVNDIGDFLSSVIVGLLWTAFGTTIAFGYGALLFIAGALLIVRVHPSVQTKT